MQRKLAEMSGDEALKFDRKRDVQQETTGSQLTTGEELRWPLCLGIKTHSETISSLLFLSVIIIVKIQ